MELTSNNTIAETLQRHKAELLADWLKELQNTGLRRDDLMRARQIAKGLGFDSQVQTRIATAVSEIARNAFKYAGGGKVEFIVEGESPQIFRTRISDTGPGIADISAVLSPIFDPGPARDSV